MSDSDNNSKRTSSSSSTALTRLNQVTSHLPSPPPPPRRPRTSSSHTPKPPPLAPDYSDILAELTHLRTLATTPDPRSTGYARQKAAGKLWVRERVARCFDQGSVREVGSVSGSVEWRRRRGPGTTGDGEEEEVAGFTPSNNVGGEFSCSSMTGGLLGRGGRHGSRWLGWSLRS